MEESERMTKITTIVFDLDGTLLNTLDDLADSTNYALAQFGFPTRSVEEVRRFVGNGVRKLMERAVPAGTDSARVEAVFDCFKRYYVEHCMVKTDLYPGVADLLHELKTAGYKIAIESNKLQGGVDELYRHYFQDTVQVAVGERVGTRRKPAPDMVEIALQELGVEKEVTFAGWISGGMDRFYSALDINDLTSLSETFPYALTEGARFHLATVATAVGGIPYLIDQDVNGYLFIPGDWQTLGRYLAALGNEDALRREMGEKLYEKASAKFSIQSTVDTQLHIYEEIIRRHNRPKRDRDGVVICGAYGRGNAGDDAILEAILQEMRAIDPDMPITVLTKDPKATRLTYRVRTAGRMDVLTWKKAMRHAGLYINGGGSLIQDVTSRRSLWFYLHNIQAAHKAGCKVQMYGCGIGPVLREQHRKLAASVLNASVDVITLREPDSLKELQSMGVTKPEILLTADPALTLPAASEDEIDSVLLRAGIPTHGKYLCFALRNWKGFEDKAPLFGQAAKYAYETYGLTPVFAAVEKHLDPVAGRLAAAGLDIPHYFLDDAGSAGTIIGALSRMQAVVSMRLHALIFAAGQGIPLAGVVYDPKVSAFLRYIGQENFLDLDALTADALKAMIDRMVSSPISPEEQAAAVQKLRQIEQVNVDTARRLLGK